MATKPIYSTSQIITQVTTSWGNGMTGWTLSWPSTLPTISYSINTTTPSNFPYTPSEGGAYLVTMSALQAATAALSFQLWDDLIAKAPGTDHRLVQSTSPSANITLDYSSNTSGGGTYTNYRAVLNPSAPKSGYITAEQIWLNSSWSTNGDSGMSPGRYGLFTMIHEIGHSLGLSHPGVYNAGGGTITYDNNAVFAQDQRQYTVMSYFGGYLPGYGWCQDGTSTSYIFPQTPMVYDIAAIQAKYGADTITRLGDTVYGFNCNLAATDPEKAIYNFATNLTPIFTIWDAGGTDTLDCSGYAGVQVINLTPGSYSSVDGMKENVAIAFNCAIEKVIGGSGNDVIIGGTGIQYLNGGNGSDVYIINAAAEHTAAEFADTGTTGSDEVRFASTTANETLTLYAWDTGIESVVIGTGTACVVSGQAITITAAVTTGTTPLNVDASAVLNGLSITGNAGANTILGTAYNDVIIGGGGMDHLDGWHGSDIYLINAAAEHSAAEIADTGTTGIDEVRFASVTANDTLTLYAGDTGIENVVIGTGTATAAVTTGTTPLNVDASAVLNGLSITGNAGVNTLTGTAFNDVIIGGGGVDHLNGGHGSDIYIINAASEHTAAEIADTGTTGSDEVRFASVTANDTLLLFSGDTGIERVVIGTGTASSAVTTGTTALHVDASGVLNGLTIIGNDGANILKGTAFNDVLIGGNGNDTLTGGLGADTFAFTTQPNASTNHDTITDFQPGVDVLQFSKGSYTSISSAIGGLLNANEFWSGSGVTSGHTVDDRFVYDTATGNLYYDADGSGSGAAVLVALIGTTTHPALASTDISVVA